MKSRQMQYKQRFFLNYSPVMKSPERSGVGLFTFHLLFLNYSPLMKSPERSGVGLFTFHLLFLNYSPVTIHYSLITLELFTPPYALITF